MILEICALLLVTGVYMSPKPLKKETTNIVEYGETVAFEDDIVEFQTGTVIIFANIGDEDKTGVLYDFFNDNRSCSSIRITKELFPNIVSTNLVIQWFRPDQHNSNTS